MQLHMRFRVAALLVLLAGVLLAVLQLMRIIPNTAGPIMLTIGVFSTAAALFSWSLHNPEFPHRQDELRRGLLPTIMFGCMSVIMLIWGALALAI